MTKQMTNQDKLLSALEALDPNNPGIDIARICRAFQDHLTLDQVTEPKLTSQGMITIEVEDGVVVDVRGIPDGYQYEILDHDVENEQ